jgi:hypothetical protein
MLFVYGVVSFLLKWASFILAPVMLSIAWQNLVLHVGVACAVDHIGHAQAA